MNFVKKNAFEKSTVNDMYLKDGLIVVFYIFSVFDISKRLFDKSKSSILTFVK